MAKITRHGGPSDAHDINGDDLDPLSSDEHPEPGEAIDPDGQPVQPEDVNATHAFPAGADDPTALEQQDAGAHLDDEGESDDGTNEPAGDPDDEDPDAGPVADLPAKNALKADWESALLEAGVSEAWVYAEGRTKDDLIAAGVALNDGSQVLVEGAPTDPAETPVSPGDTTE